MAFGPGGWTPGSAPGDIAETVSALSAELSHTKASDQDPHPVHSFWVQPPHWPGSPAPHKSLGLMAGSLDVFSLGPIATLAAIRVQGVRIEHFHLDFPEF